MLRAIEYSAIELLRDGSQIQIRSLKPDDREKFVAAVSCTSSQSLYRRFFAARRSFTDEEVGFFLKVDFVNHVALIAVIEESERPVVGGGRYVVVQPGMAEVAFVVIDKYQRRGVGAALMRHLVAIACDAGIRELIAEMLPDNYAMMRMLENTGLPLSMVREPMVVRATLQLA